MPQPNPHSLSQFIQAAANGSRDSLLHLVAVILSTTKAALASIAQHYKTHPRALTLDKLARLKYCAVRLQAIFHTLTHAPGRFFTPAQLRALTRAQAVLAHIWRQPVDFSPLTPLLTSPEACPPPPRAPHSALPSSESEPSSVSSTSHPASPPLRVPASSSSSPADPLLLRSPGRALASVLLHIAALYGISSSPRSPRCAHSFSSSPSASPCAEVSAIISNSPLSPSQAGSGVNPAASIHTPSSPRPASNPPP